MRAVAFGFIGLVIGAIAGLVVTSLLNANCDSFFEVASGCTRYRPGALAGWGGAAGAAFGLIAGLPRKPK